MIIDLMDPSNYNNNYYKDRFLGNMYRIVSLSVNIKFNLNLSMVCNLHICSIPTVPGSMLRG